MENLGVERLAREAGMLNVAEIVFERSSFIRKRYMVAGAQNVLGWIRSIASIISIGWNFSVSYAPTAAPQIHWP